jgi:hypothetical protein
MKNLDALEGIEREKVRVTAHDTGRVATHSEFEQLVVLRITASSHPDIHIDPLRFAREGRQKVANVFLIDIRAELRSAQNIAELSEHSKGEHDSSFSQRQIEGLARRRIR